MRCLIKHSIVLVLVAGLAGCGDDGDDPVDTGAGMPGIVGQLIDGSGQGVAAVQVLACQATTCYFGESDAEGRFEFDINPPAEVALKTHANLASTPRLAAALEPVDIVDDTRIDLGTVYVPDLPAGAVIGPATDDPQILTAGDGLELTVSRADLTAPIGELLYDVAARRIPIEHVPIYTDLGSDHILAIYALHPFATRSATPIAVRAPLDLPDGTAVSFHTVSELDGNCSPAVPGQANGGYVTTDPGTGITHLTYLVITM